MDSLLYIQLPFCYSHNGNPFANVLFFFGFKNVVATKWRAEQLQNVM